MDIYFIDTIQFIVKAAPTALKYHIGCKLNVVFYYFIWVLLAPIAHISNYRTFKIGLDIYQVKFSISVLLHQYCLGYSWFISLPYKFENKQLPTHMYTHNTLLCLHWIKSIYHFFIILNHFIREHDIFLNV